MIHTEVRDVRHLLVWATFSPFLTVSRCCGMLTLGVETLNESQIGKPQGPESACQLFRYSNYRTGQAEQKQHICKKPNSVRVVYLGDFDET